MMTGDGGACCVKEGRPGSIASRMGGSSRRDQARLQVQDGTPAAVIASLRRYARDYRRVCQVDLPVARPIPLVAPEQMGARLTADYWYLVALIRCQKGFWRAAAVLADAARYKQRTQASRGGPPGIRRGSNGGPARVELHESAVIGC
ncbi:hypothetical protein WT71_19880 [Burkholderia stagnalis]|nr:hypothetical protein WT71_19880 [Burkholderia stagnalis]KWI71356.1 hypothetical protein WT73_00865 [Burkholderia stagnalis]